MGGGADRSAPVRAEESVSGGVDVWSDAVSSHAPDHLLVMVHGILGSTADWQYGANEFVKQLPDHVIVHCSEKNASMLTLDGVDVMGERLANEVLDVISRRPEITKISFLAHSVGGLAARYAIARLYRHPDSVSDGNTKGTICGLEGINFITVATPHLGSRGNKQVPLLFGSVAMEKVACHIVHWIFRRTGRHLFLTDDDEGLPPLLQRMVEDHDDLYFISALRAFRRRVVYANADCDRILIISAVGNFLYGVHVVCFIVVVYFWLCTSLMDKPDIVGWRTSSIRRNNELPELPVSSSDKYPHIVHEEHSEETDDDKWQDCMAECDMDVLEEKMVTGLGKVSWEKVDVSFHSSMTSFAAHSIIQVKYAFMNEGADVIQHIIDHFQL
ncbi:alpha/beta-Hydrolases superfamily protein [Zea mays]|uniref:Alpha/beta-Hydrolases superfamily protein n=1 Tax=Zea mays TaxID=4577 RepID=A0A1D6J0U3_MAIZE|nr:alpha/beta-Hydrolases superfamily protein [Zea mays]